MISFDVSIFKISEVTIRQDLEKLEKDGFVTREHGGASDFNGLVTSAIPITGMIGDSHAAAFGEGCYRPGTAKPTLGTGSSILWNTGPDPVFSTGGMVTAICWSTENRVDYALEGVIVSCGSIIEWLKNQLGLFAVSQETEAMARSVPDNNGVYLIPAFSGLGAPHWKMDTRARITGIGSGIFENIEELEAFHQQQHTYHPVSAREDLLSAYQGWKKEIENL